MNSSSPIPDVRLVGFYQLKELLGLGDDRLRMLLEVGEVKPITFTNSKTGKVDKLYSLFSIKEALQRLQDVDVQLEYDMIHNPEYEEVISKFKNIQLRLIKKNKSANG